MSGIYNFKRQQPTVWFHENLNKSNRYCLYCGKDLSTDGVESNKEHLIAKNFVPKGSFNNGKGFNLIFRACKPCNDRKGILDRHVSSITLFNSSACKDDQQARNNAQRKADSDYHPDKQGTLIKDSHDEHTISGQLMPGVNVSVKFISPPRLKAEHAHELAFRHIQGIFSLITSSNPSEPENTNLLPRKNFLVFDFYKESDWGNPQLQEIVSRTSYWPCYANINTANGFFKAIMKRDNKKKSGWVWAIEWNKSYRIIGAIGRPNIFNDLPKLNWKQVSKNERIREETPLNHIQDILFDAPISND